jgi:hypothetical protein
VSLPPVSKSQDGDGDDNTHLNEKGENTGDNGSDGDGE